LSNSNISENPEMGLHGAFDLRQTLGRAAVMQCISRGLSPDFYSSPIMKKTLLAVAALCALTSGAAMAQQQDGKWQVRVRAVNLDAANKGSAADALGLSVNDKVIPELDISYYFTPNFAAELILTYPQKHNVRSNGTKIGTLKHLPPTLLAQYHFTNFGAFKPYVGAGINYTRFSNVDLLGGVADVKRNSWGGALQVGFDYALDKNWSLNFDVKKVYIDTDVSVGGLNMGKFKVDPLLVGVGVGYRF
jgi:outer membrane protein